MADVVDSKEQLRFRAMCDERISFPFEELRPFQDVYAKLEPYVQASSYVEVKVAWRCNTEQWWWAEVEPAKAGPFTESRAIQMKPSGLLAWIQSRLWGLLCWVRLPLALTLRGAADGISRPSTPSHHGGECELRHGEGFKEEGWGQGKAHFLGQG